MRRYILSIAMVLFLGVIALPLCGQEKKHLTPADAAYQNPALYARGLSGLQWIPETNFYSFIAKNKLVLTDASNGKSDTILSLSELTDLFAKLSLKAPSRFPAVSFKNRHEILIQRDKVLVTINLKDKQIKKNCEWPADAANLDLANSTYYAAFTRKNNLWVVLGSDTINISKEANPDIVYGAENVHRNEFGITKGTFWSPDGSKLAFYRMDQTMVTDYPLVDINTRPAELNSIKYPMAGMKSHQVTIGIFDTKNQSVIYLKTGEPVDQYLTNVTWNPEGTEVWIAVLNRDQNHLKLNRYNASTGEFLSTILEEKNERYVEPEEGPFFLAGTNGDFLWMSERDGYNHIYRYSGDGKMLKQLTKGPWVVLSIDLYNPKTGVLYFSSTKESPLQKNAYSLNLKNGTVKRLTPEHGSHSVKYNSDGSYLIDQWSSTDVALAQLLIKTDNLKSKEITTAKNPVADYEIGTTKLFTLKNKEGVDLWCRMITPPDFDSTKKYPAIVYVYGGPHAQLITDSWLAGAGYYLNYLASQGYVVFTLDNRGSANRGFEFESVIHRQCGKLEMEDQMTGVNWLKSHKWIDSERIGVDGWSYGGFMTISLALNYPDVFKVATAGGPVIDWKYYEIMYGERYMDTPETNPEGFKNSSLLNKVNNLKARLMIIHCTTDPVVVWQNSLSFVDACIKAGVLIDYFVYPGHDHNVAGPDRAHLVKKIEDYYKRNL